MLIESSFLTRDRNGSKQMFTPFLLPKFLRTFLFPKDVNFRRSTNTSFTFVLHSVLSGTSCPLPRDWATRGLDSAPLLSYGPSWLHPAAPPAPPTLSAASRPFGQCHVPTAPDHAVGGSPSTATSHSVARPAPRVSRPSASVALHSLISGLPLGALFLYSQQGGTFPGAPLSSLREHIHLCNFSLHGESPGAPFPELFFLDQLDTSTISYQNSATTCPKSCPPSFTSDRLLLLITLFC